MSLPVTMRTTVDRGRHQFHSNPRNPHQMAALTLEVAELNRRTLWRGKRHLEVERLPNGPSANGSGPFRRGHGFSVPSSCKRRDQTFTVAVPIETDPATCPIRT